MPVSARRLAAPAALVACALALATPAAHAAPTAIVTTLAASGPGSLETAVSTVDDGGTILFSVGLSGTIELSSPLFLTRAVTIAGPGAQRVTVSGDDSALPFYVDGSGDVEISGLTIADGRGVSSGGGVHGGALFKSGTGALTIRDSSVLDSVALADSAGLVAGGGGISVEEGDLTLERVTIAGNRAIAANGASQARGGGIELSPTAGAATLRDVTVSGNEAAGPSSSQGAASGASGSPDRSCWSRSRSPATASSAAPPAASSGPRRRDSSTP